MVANHRLTIKGANKIVILKQYRIVLDQRKRVLIFYVTNLPFAKKFVLML